MTLKRRYHTLRLILGDQLNAKHSWFKNTDDSVLFLIAELKQEATYVKHHIQKVSAFFAAMEVFANALHSAGHHVLHLTLDDTVSFDKLEDLLSSLIRRYAIKEFQFQRPDEFRLISQLRNLSLENKAETVECDTEHFLLPFDEIPDYVKPSQHNRMETFYRKMRVRFNILLEDGKPTGGKWNYDSENREKLKPADLSAIPDPVVFANDVKAVIARIKKHKVPYFGQEEERLLWPISRAQSLKLLKHFCDRCLPEFGRFQDAMTCQSPNAWSLYHSRLSFAINSKMLHPTQVIRAALKAFEQSEGKINLAQIEGFIRQILGWREYVRCVYWANMPNYQTQNALKADRPLPQYFWDGNTKMQCMKSAIGQSLSHAYAHHIQRLMITGNFCLLTGIAPDEVDAWYLGIYIDAIEWVEMPNTRGMSQFADDGWVATKPYAAGGNYVNKMSDYCKNCHYKVKEKVSEDACPFNSLYWYFMTLHRDKLARNPRIGMIYRSWDKQSESQQQDTLQRAKWCLDHIEDL